MENLLYKLKKSGALFLLSVLLILSVMIKAMPLAHAQNTEVTVINPATGNSDFVFYSNATPVGWRFNASVWVYDVADVFAYQVKLYVNDTLLNITRAWRPTWDPQWIFYGNSTVGTAPAYYDIDHDNSRESVLVGDTLFYGQTPFTGTALLAIIEFAILYQPPTGTVTCPLNITNPDTLLLNSALTQITPITTTNGNYEYIHIAVPPIAQFTYSPVPAKVNEPVTFNATLSQPNGGFIVNYTWNFGDGTPEVTETDPIVEHTYITSGTFLVTLTVYDTEELSNTTSQEITVMPGIPVLKIEPDYYYYTHRGEIFNVTVKIENLDASLRMIGIQFRLRYDKSFVEVLEMIEGPFLPLFPQDPNPPHTYFMAFDEPEDPYHGTHVVIGDLLLPEESTGQWPGPFPEGEGVLAIITFKVTGVTPGIFNFQLFDTMLIDDEFNEIPHDSTSVGLFELYALTVTITDQPQLSYGVLSITSIKFVVQYPNGTYYTADDLGSVTVSIFNGTYYIANITLTESDYDPTSHKWTATWQIPRDASLVINYTYVIRAHNVIDKVGNSGPLVDVSSTKFKALQVVVLDVQIEVGKIHFRGEKAEFSILILCDGKRFGENVTNVKATLYKPDGLTEALSVTYITTGFFKATYIITPTDSAGTYTLMVEASFIIENADYSGAAIGSFSVSSTLTDWDPMIKYINGTIATVATKVGEVQLDLQMICANVTQIEGNVVTINSTLGTIQTHVANINATVAEIKGNVVTINSTLGTIQTHVANINATVSTLIVDAKGEILAKINTALGPVTTKLDNLSANVTRIDGNTVTISTTLGEIQTALDLIQDSIGTAQSAVTTTLYITAPLSAIAVIIGIVILMVLKKK